MYNSLHEDFKGIAIYIQRLAYKTFQVYLRSWVKVGEQIVSREVKEDVAKRKRSLHPVTAVQFRKGEEDLQISIFHFIDSD